MSGNVQRSKLYDDTYDADSNRLKTLVCTNHDKNERRSEIGKDRSWPKREWATILVSFRLLWTDRILIWPRALLPYWSEASARRLSGDSPSPTAALPPSPFPHTRYFPPLGNTKMPNETSTVVARPWRIPQPAAARGTEESTDGKKADLSDSRVLVSEPFIPRSSKRRRGIFSRFPALFSISHFSNQPQ